MEVVAPEACGNCRFWLETAELKSGNYGLCRIVHVYADRFGDEWCGEWQAQAPAAPDPRLAYHKLNGQPCFLCGGPCQWGGIP